MVLDLETKNQLLQYLSLLESEVVFKVSNDNKDIIEFINEVVALDSKLSIEFTELKRNNTFGLAKKGEQPRVFFSGLPMGHEFSSFVLALLQVAGRKPKISDELIKEIQSISSKLVFETYVSLSCHNCPDVVQALNMMSVLNPNITHTMIEGSLFQDEVTAKQILAVPTVILNDEEFGSGRMSLEQIVAKVNVENAVDILNQKEDFDVLVIGGGPAGNAAAIYAARKGIRVGLVAQTYGGQVLDTVGIENMIGTPYTEGSKLMANIEEHAKEYPIDIIKGQKVVNVVKEDKVIVTLENGATLKSKTLILALGAKWRNVNVEGEEQFRNKGVTNCPHCDGPLFTGKNVAVIGGGNSGVEAALDLAGIAKEVYILEFMSELKADAVLVNRAQSLNNVHILKNVATKSINGDQKVTSLTYIENDTKEEKNIDVEGIFVQIGLVPNTAWLKDSGIELNSRGEIIVNSHQATNIDGIFAAGDCTDSIYKQIIISMGSGASAALAAFDYLIRN